MSYDSKEWLQQHEKIKAHIQIRRKNGLGFVASDRKSINLVLNTLESQLKGFSLNSADYDISASEIARRQVLIEHLKRQIANSSTNYPEGPPVHDTSSNQINNSFVETQSSSLSFPENKNNQGQIILRKEMIKMQDAMLEDIEHGVERLLDQANSINDETRVHNRLLSSVEGKVDAASSRLAAETSHTEKISSTSGFCLLYVIIAVEALVLLSLIVASVDHHN